LQATSKQASKQAFEAASKQAFEAFDPILVEPLVTIE
tara:strand:+ start:252 stop:362 length:111 start_codon:yes stop_codon:yes gene_type:complete